MNSSTLINSVREQIVADGWDYKLDWNRSGKEVNSTIWNQGLENDETIVLDCRNSYESDVGVFDKAIPLNTTFFRESWDALDEILNDVPKDRPIMTYCTGGIRCVKINAYLEQKLGFTNVSRLAGGIISYVKEMQESNGAGVESLPGESSIHLERNVWRSKFKGMNYVFDERMGSRVTKDILSTCETCGDSHDIFTNCAFTGCHIRFIQCSSCHNKYDGCCSKACQTSHLRMRASAGNDAMLPRPKAKERRIIQVPAEAEVFPDENRCASSKDTSESTQFCADAFLDAINNYCERRTAAEPPLLKTLKHETETLYPPAVSRMLCGHLQGRLIVALCSLMKAEHVLELGTFTGFHTRNYFLILSDYLGYSTLCFAEGILEEGRIVTCDIDSKAVALAKSYFQKSLYGHKVESRLCSANELIDDCRTTGRKFDVVFIDADKKAYMAYLKAILDEDGEGRCLLNPSGLIIVDNTLWKLMVLEEVRPCTSLPF